MLVVTGAAHREQVVAQLAHLGGGRVVAEPSPRDSMAAIGLRRRAARARGPGRGDGLVRRRPRDRRPRGVRPGRDPGGRRRPGRLAGHRRHPARPCRPRPSATCARARRWPVTTGRSWSRSSSRSRRSRWPGATSRPAPTAGTPACSSSARGCCSTCWPRGIPASRRPCATWPRRRTGSTSSGRPCRRSPSTTPWPSRPRPTAGSRRCRASSPGTTSATSAPCPTCSATRPATCGCSATPTSCGPTPRPGWWCRAAADVVAVVGLDDVVVVDTPDALLVTTRARAQEVKAIVDRLRETGRADLT